MTSVCIVLLIMIYDLLTQRVELVESAMYCMIGAAPCMTNLLWIELSNTNKLPNKGQHRVHQCVHYSFLRDFTIIAY